MNITWSIDSRAGLVRLVYVGDVDYPTWEATMLEIFAHPDYRPGLGFVANLTDAAAPDQAHLRRVTEFVAAHQDEMGTSRWANVTKKPAHVGMTRMAQVFVEDMGNSLQVFSDQEEAERWATGGPSPEDS